MASSASRKAVRTAFDKLDTQEKSAFIFEATFNTIGQALEETGRRVSDLMSDFDVEDLFTPADEADAAPDPPSARKKASPRAKTTKRPPKASGSTKTAGKPKPDDDA